MRSIKYLITAIGPVLLAWLLGIVKLPESTSFLDYSRGGSELLNLSDELKKEVRVFVGKDEKEKLSLYNVQFINKSPKHYGKMKISFDIESKDGTELIASGLQGPENYPNNSISKKSETQQEVTFIVNHINRAGNQSRNYFTASFLFSGIAPEVIRPISHEKGVEFRPASENTRVKWIVRVIFIGVIIGYLWFLWWLIKKDNIKQDEKNTKFKQKLKEYLLEKLSGDSGITDKLVQEIESMRNEVYKPPPGVIKRFIRKMVEEEP